MADELGSLGDPEVLRRLLVSRGVPADARGDALMEAAAKPEHKFGVAMLSAAEAAGDPLSPAQQEELAENRHRISRYEHAWSVVSAAAPDAYVVKGTFIADRYPAGLLRGAGDMDLMCPVDQLWPAAQMLAAEGYELGAFTLFSGLTPEDEVETLVELMLPSDTSIEEHYGVELRTIEVATSLVRPAVRLSRRLTPVAGSVFALAAERWEREFRTRDIYDLAILQEHLDDAELASLVAGLTEAELWPEMLELACCATLDCASPWTCRAAGGCRCAPG